MDLQGLGFYWPGTTTHDAIVRFQWAYNGPPSGANTKGWLAVDGIAGPMTNAAYDWCMQHGGGLSPNFAFTETRCHHCGQNFVRRELLEALETLRRVRGNHPLSVLDVCRCPPHNKAIGGAANSQHQYGTAFDVATPVTRADFSACERWSGIGWRPNVNPCHGDVRHIFGASALNESRGSVANPTVFREG